MRSCLLALLLLCWIGTVCQAQGVIVRSHLDPQTGAVVGQHMRIMIDVLFKGDMPRPPRVTIGETPGAQILRLETQATTMTDTIGGQSYVGKRFEFALYPRRGGTIAIPPASITLLDVKGDEIGTLKGEELRAEIVVPKGVDASGPVVATSEATLEQRWQPAPTTAFRVGDALVRTIARTAADMPAMAMRDLAFPAPPGVRVYVDPPRGEDSENRGDLVGRRIDRVTYVFGTPGTVELPAVTQPWWDLGNNRLEEAKGSGVKLTVAAPAPASADARGRAAIAIGLAVALLVVGCWSAPRVRAIWIDRRRRWRQSETKSFRDLDRACRHGDVRAIYGGFVIWRQRTGQSRLLVPLAEELEQSLFGPDRGRSWSNVESRHFRAKIRDARRTMRNVRKGVSGRDLPPLNPSAYGSA
jgi:hypothetical protein